MNLKIDKFSTGFIGINNNNLLKNNMTKFIKLSKYFLIKKQYKKNNKH